MLRDGVHDDDDDDDDDDDASDLDRVDESGVSILAPKGMIVRAAVLQYLYRSFSVDGLW